MHIYYITTQNLSRYILKTPTPSPLHSSHTRVWPQNQRSLPEWVELMPYMDPHFPPRMLTLKNYQFMKFSPWKCLGKKKKKKFQLTLHLSTLINSTCFPPKGVVEAKLGIPTSSRTSASFAPPQMAESRYT